MDAIKFTCDVHCIRPNWAMHHWLDIYKLSAYRIYVNSDLITERTWLWDNSVYLQENIVVNLKDTHENSVRLVPIVEVAEQAEFEIKNLKLDNKNIEILDQSKLSISFKIK